MWIEWDGADESPVEADTPVEVRYRDLEDSTRGYRFASIGLYAGDYSWWHDGTDDDIVAYRIVEGE